MDGWMDGQTARIPDLKRKKRNNNFKKQQNNRRENEDKKTTSAKPAARDLLNKFTFQELIGTCEKLSPVIFQRHKKDPNGDYRLGQIYEEVSVNSTLEDIEKLLAHANKTYIVQPKYNTLDLCWVLNNQKAVMSAKELTTIENNSQQRDYDSED